MKVCIIPIMNISSTIPVEYETVKGSMTMNCVHAACSGHALEKYDRIIFGIYSRHEDAYMISDRIMTDVKCLCKDSKVDVSYNIEFVFIDDPTSSMAMTVMKMIEMSGINDNDEIYIKDGDNSWVSDTFMETSGNFVTVASLEETNRADTIHKSYVKVDEQGFLTNCIEKKVLSDKFIAGGYSFSRARLFIEAYENLNYISKVFYISDMIFWLILNKNEKFRPVYVKNFKDYNI